MPGDLKQHDPFLGVRVHFVWPLGLFMRRLSRVGAPASPFSQAALTDLVVIGGYARRPEKTTRWWMASTIDARMRWIEMDMMSGPNPLVTFRSNLYIDDFGRFHHGMDHIVTHPLGSRRDRPGGLTKFFTLNEGEWYETVCSMEMYGTT